MYQTHLPDLFRYGLKPFIDAKDSSPYLSRQMCDRLSALLLSPVWGGDVGRVRYALQTAVLRRRDGIKLEGSGRPTPMPSLGPQSSLGMDEFARTMQAIAQLEGIVGSETTVEVKADVVAMARATYSPTDKDKLLRQIITAIETAPEIDQCPCGGNETKSGLYLLRIEDVQLVTEVVDCLGHLDPVRMTCLDRLRLHFPDPDQWQQHFELDQHHHLRWKKKYILSARRDFAMAHIMQHLAPSPENLDYYLLDAPKAERAFTANWQTLVELATKPQRDAATCLQWHMFNGPPLRPDLPPKPTPPPSPRHSVLGPGPVFCQKPSAATSRPRTATAIANQRTALSGSFPGEALEDVKTRATWSPASSYTGAASRARPDAHGEPSAWNSESE